MRMGTVPKPAATRNSLVECVVPSFANCFWMSNLTPGETPRQSMRGPKSRCARLCLGTQVNRLVLLGMLPDFG